MMIKVNATVPAGFNLVATGNKGFGQRDKSALARSQRAGFTILGIKADGTIKHQYFHTLRSIGSRAIYEGFSCGGLLLPLPNHPLPNAPHCPTFRPTIPINRSHKNHE
jgi:hypothetical protein